MHTAYLGYRLHFEHNSNLPLYVIYRFERFVRIKRDARYLHVTAFHIYRKSIYPYSALRSAKRNGTGGGHHRPGGINGADDMGYLRSIC